MPLLLSPPLAPSLLMAQLAHLLPRNCFSNAHSSPLHQTPSPLPSSFPNLCPSPSLTLVDFLTHSLLHTPPRWHFHCSLEAFFLFLNNVLTHHGFAAHSFLNPYLFLSAPGQLSPTPLGNTTTSLLPFAHAAYFTHSWAVLAFLSLAPLVFVPVKEQLLQPFCTCSLMSLCSFLFLAREDPRHTHFLLTTLPPLPAPVFALSHILPAFTFD